MAGPSRQTRSWWRHASFAAGFVLFATLLSCHRTRSTLASDVSDLPAPLPIALHNAALPESLSDSAFWEYLFQQDDNWRRFYLNVGTMPLEGGSRFIRSVTNRGFNGPSNFLMTQLSSLFWTS